MYIDYFFKKNKKNMIDTILLISNGMKYDLKKKKKHDVGTKKCFYVCFVNILEF